MASKHYIGFATQFYTLWYVDQDFTYAQTPSGEWVATGITYKYSYLGKLSKDQDKAIQKVQERGIEKYGLDMDLRGTRSWTRTDKTYCKIPSNVCSVFQFGKYDGQSILDCTDEWYVEWYYGQTHNIYAKKVLLDGGLWVEWEDRLIERAVYDRMQRRTAILDTLQEGKEIEFLAVRNLDYQGRMEYRVDDAYICLLKFPEYSLQHYNGHEYGLPLMKGQAKRIKGKTLLVKIGNKSENEYQENTWEVLEWKFK